MKRRNTTRKNFILVAEIASKGVKIIIEGPDERVVRKGELDKADTAIEQKANELFAQYPAHTHEIIITRASDIDDLKQTFPEFVGWSEVKITHLLYT